MHHKGLGVRKDIPKAYKFYEEAAFKKHKVACYEQARMIQKGEIETGADQETKFAGILALYQASAMQGHAGALTELGKIMQKFDEEPNYEQIQTYFEEACIQNYAPAYNALGMLYFKNLIRPKETVENKKMAF